MSVRRSNAITPKVTRTNSIPSKTTTNNQLVQKIQRSNVVPPRKSKKAQQVSTNNKRRKGSLSYANGETKIIKPSTSSKIL